MKKDNTEFKSSLGSELEAYLSFRKSQGHNAGKERHIFQTLDSYLQECQIYKETPILLPEVVDGWIQSLPESLNVNSRNLYVSHYTMFARYRRSKGTEAFIPERSLPDMTYVPYIFSKEELFALIAAADRRFEAAAREPLKRNSACFLILIRMLVGCGFRINELLNLKTMDVDFGQRLVIVRNAKGKKDRIVPFHDTLADSLRLYYKSGIPQVDGYFFPSITGKKLSYSWARDSFNRLLSDVGIIKPELKPHERNICMHCIRHSYAVAITRQLDQDGVDLYSEVPILSTYLGHKNIYGTEKYLHMTASNGADILKKMADYCQGVFPEVSL